MGGTGAGVPAPLGNLAYAGREGASSGCSGAHGLAESSSRSAAPLTPPPPRALLLTGAAAPRAPE